MVDKNQGEQTLTKMRTAPDREVTTMGKISRLLAELGADERRRIVAWVGEKYSDKQ